MNTLPDPAPLRSPELLAPAGGWDAAKAAAANGADAIYFGLDCGFNARFRARNFSLAELPDLTAMLRRHGVRGYATMNTLAFPSELPRLAEIIEQVAAAGVDAVLVQDFGVARLVRAICPELEIHASTQMSLTSAETISVAADLGLSRVVLARELSVAEVTRIASASSLPLEVFIHGALCVAYSGQCLTSESLGGRSANRGQCAQACRLPYELVCDGEDRDLGEVRYLLSPQDLAGYAAIPDLIRTGVASLKIEGRLKTPEYVANITRHYRRAIDEAVSGKDVTFSEEEIREMELSFSRGFAPGWLQGNDHKRLVPGRQSAKRGIPIGEVLEIGRGRIRLEPSAPLRRGDGLAIVTDQEEDQGGRIYSLHDSRGKSLTEAAAGRVCWVGFGRGEIDWRRVQPGASVFKNDDPQLNRRLRKTFSGSMIARPRPIDIRLTAHVGQPLVLAASFAPDSPAQRPDTPPDRSPTTSGNAPPRAEVIGPEPLAAAIRHPATEAMLREKVGRLGGTPFRLGSFRTDLAGDPMVPVGMLNQLRRDLVEHLERHLDRPPRRDVELARGRALLDRSVHPRAAEASSERLRPADGSPAQLAVLCRTPEQLAAAVESGVDLVYADFHDIRLHRDAVATARAAGVPVGLASIRMHKPGETGLLRAVTKHRPDFVLARNLAALQHSREAGVPVIADFSLNVANQLSATWIESLGAERWTASYDLNRDQLTELVDAADPKRLEVVLHQHMPLFHMEHCVFCAVLSPGTDKTNCGRPCDRHVVQLRDRVGAEHPLQADIACRNTLYNATPQSGAELAETLKASGVVRYRIELLAEAEAETRRTIELYRELLRGSRAGREVWQSLKAANRLGVTRGTLETDRNPLAIL